MANRDKSQGIGFVYSNIYELYKKAQLQAKQAATTTHTETQSGRMIRIADLGKIKAASTPQKKLSTIDELQANIKQLNELHAKLRFMLDELEALVVKR